MSKPIYILGTGVSHDGSSCLLKDGKILVAIEKERLTKKKHDGMNDNLTIQYCLDAAGITFKDLTLLVEENTTDPLLKPKAAERIGDRIIPDDVPIMRISHHVAHAYSVIGMSPFDEMSVVIMDGQGSSLNTCIDVKNRNILPPDIRNLSKESYYIFKNGILIPVFKDFSKYHKWERNLHPVAPYDIEHSIAQFYGGISHYIFDEEFCEGKTMGLAPFGRPGIYSYDAFELSDNRAFLKHDWMKNFDSYLGGKYQSFSEYFQYYADLAFWAQYQIEKAIFYIFNSYYDLYPHENVGYAGGLALNAVANSKLLKNTKFENFYFQPPAGDSGLSIGCCYYGWYEILKKEKVRHNGSVNFGKKYSNDEIGSCLIKNCDKFNIIQNDEFIEEAAQLLAQGKILGWFQDGSEFGPRALGCRSILADPRRKDIKNFINRKVKSREDFRPFAPSVLREDVSRYFDYIYESPYMLLVASVKDEWRDKIPGIVHKDGSARIQTVDKETNFKYYTLINKFKKITGISLLLNTSFNDRGLPIVETIGDAVSLFLRAKAMDALIIDNYIITRRP
jgi:carbamoyltransferase